MKRYLYFLFLFFVTGISYAQPAVFKLNVTFKPFKKQYIYLGYHYGKQKPIIDSVMLDENSVGIFRSKKEMEKGVYLIGYPNKAGYFEILIDKEQQFSVMADTANLINSLKFAGSPDNVLFVEYQRYTAGRGREIEAAKSQLAAAKTKADSARLNAAIKKGGEDIQQYRMNLIKQHPDATITALLNAMKEPPVPPAAKHPGGNYDSLFAYHFFKDHFWDDTYFFDERLVRTSFFEEKIDQYYEQLVYPNPDSVIKEIDWMMGYAAASSEMERFLLTKFVNRYINPRYMWDDRVFVHLFEKYFSQKTYPWLTEKGKKTIFDRAYSMMANLFGSQAADVELPDSSGKMQTLFSITNPYTLVVFWDPACGHCKETLPKLDSMYRAKWKAANVKIFAVSKETENSKKEWLQFVNDQQLRDWVHVYYSRTDDNARVSNNIPSYFQLYDVQTVPALYLLDKDKRILAKKISFEQIDEVLQHKLKSQ
jgi:thiol-disulfide isomerase/thioredoxin